VTDKDSAYIAGFLDGDGCIMLQLVYRKDYLLGYQIRASVVFYQNQQNYQSLAWLKRKLTYGYIRNRKDGITEYAIVGARPVGKILKILRPYLRLKKKQATLALKILSQMPGSGRQMTPQLLLKLAREVDKFADLNYSKKRTNNSRKVEEFLKSRLLL